MPAYRISGQAKAELDDIWLYVAQDSGSIEIANSLVDSITALPGFGALQASLTWDVAAKRI